MAWNRVYQEEEEEGLTLSEPATSTSATRPIWRSITQIGVGGLISDPGAPAWRTVKGESWLVSAAGREDGR